MANLIDLWLFMFILIVYALNHTSYVRRMDV